MKSAFLIIQNFASKIIRTNLMVLLDLVLVVLFDAFMHSDEKFSSENGLDQQCLIYNMHKSVALLPPYLPIFVVYSVSIIGSLYNIFFGVIVIVLIKNIKYLPPDAVAFVIGLVPYMMVVATYIIILTQSFIVYELTFENTEGLFFWIVHFNQMKSGFLPLFINASMIGVFAISIVALGIVKRASLDMMIDLQVEVFGDHQQHSSFNEEEEDNIEQSARNKLMLERLLYYFGRDFVIETI